MAKINCKEIAENIREEIKSKASVYFRKPKLATILVGDRADSQVYVRNKEKTLDNVGFEYETFTLLTDTPQESVEALVRRLANDNSIDGILVQLPLPDHLDAEKILSLIPYYKDVDGLTEKNQAMLMMGKNWDDFIQPCTPLGIVKILEDQYANNLPLYNVAVIGRSNLLGNPLAQMLMRRNLTVTHLHSRSDIYNTLNKVKPHVICLCTGQKNLLSAYEIGKYDLDWHLCDIIDAGIIRDESGLRGDFKKEDYDKLDELEIDYTSVPGGVGVLTTTMLAYNLAKCFELHMKNI